MKLNALGVTSTDLLKTVDFYTTLGFAFPEFLPTDDHLEPITAPGDTRLMIDSVKLISEIMGEAPRPANHSHFALEYPSPAAVDETVEHLKVKGFKVVKQPWDAFWGQRYAVVEDPDGYKVDLYAAL
jgi:catechol 2,3-dioxygenase-like lactoylglutathione lyase family enzyme